jgi:hypothetical protein
MKKLKHNKLKNTGLIFEILTRMVVQETLDESKENRAMRIIRTHFKKNSELLKELRLYQSLHNYTVKNGGELLDLTLQARKKLNEQTLSRERYSLIKSINKTYNPEIFFNTRVSNYKLNASTFKLFEYKGTDNPEEYLTAKEGLLEHLSGKKPEVIEEEIIKTIRDQEPDIRNLTFKLIIEKFNSKYITLNSRQKNLLGMYMNNDTTSEDLKNYVYKEINSLIKEFNIISKRITDDIVKIKLAETVALTSNILTAKQLKEEHLSSMLKYYQLIDTLNEEL